MKQQAPLTLVNGQIVTPDGVAKGNVRCVDGVIDAVGDIAPEGGDQTVDAKDKYITPGLVDFGVFAVDKPAFHFGGITRAAVMPDQNPPLDYPSRVKLVAQSGKPDLWVHPLAAATKGLEGRELAEIGLMKQAGARGVATGRQWIADSGAMLRLLQYAAMLDLVVVSHAEDSGLGGSAAATAGDMATRLGLPSAPAEAEALAVARDIALAFGVPPMLLGLPGDNTYANYREANRALWRLTLLPLADKIFGGLRQGLSDWFADCTLTINLDQIPALSEDRERLWAQVTSADFLSENEKRAMLGLDPHGETP